MSDRPIPDAELAELDVVGLIEAGLRDGDRIRPELQGEGSVAAAVQLQADGATAAGLREVLGAAKAGARLDQLADAGPPEVTALLGRLLAAGAARAADDPADGEAFVSWLGSVAGLLAARGA